MNHQKPLKGWRFAGFVGSIVAAVGVACYPIIISPYLYPEQWKHMSKEIREREGIKQENIQPGGMKVWTDPFDRAGKPGNKQDARDRSRGAQGNCPWASLCQTEKSLSKTCHNWPKTRTQSNR